MVGLATLRTRLELDGRLSVEDKFWTDVQAAFVDGSDADAGKTQFRHDAFDDYEIDPSKIFSHSSQKLWMMYPDLNSRHKTAMANFTQSRTHDSEFWNFCSGQLDLLYMHLFLEMKPGLTDAFSAMMPAEHRLDSDKVESRSERECKAAPKTPSSSTPSSSQPSRAEDKVRRLMTMFDNGEMRTEISKHKLEDFWNMREYRQAKRARDVQKVQLATKRLVLDNEKEKRDKRVFYWQQYKQVGEDIRRLMREAANETIGEIKDLLMADVTTQKQEMHKTKEKIDFIEI